MTQHAREGHSPQPSTVLIVEDDADISAALADLLDLAGYHTISAGSGAAALEYLEEHSVDMVLLDLMLPDLSGFDVCKQVRDSTLSSVPIIMLTASNKQTNVREGLSAGADDYLTKPFDPSELLLRIQRLIERYHESRAIQDTASLLQHTLTTVQQQLESSRKETEIERTLRRELLHNVTTHLQALYGIVEAAMRKLPPGLERDVVLQLKGRVRGVALVYQVSEALQHDPVAIGDVIRTIASALKSMYRPWKRVLLEVEGGAVDLPVAIASPLAMVVNELMTNCFKHAFPGNRFGKIDVCYRLHGDVMELTVADNGVGAAAEQTGHGMGRAMVTQLVEGLAGQVHWQSSAEGMRVQVSIPVAHTWMTHGEPEAVA
jgi:DNA-binding response OmpR family regulator/anti-sigma regulatory factor (Ser/Thr protein kinase)